MGTYGQDWASYQSEAPSTSGLSFVFVKVTQGTSYVNPKWVAQRDHAKSAGLVWGAYHYPNMGNDVRAEADYFLSKVAWQPGDIVVLDWEGYDDANKGVPKGVQAAYKDAWLRYVKGRLPHNRVGMYANVDYWRNVDQSGYFGDFLWIATAGRAAGDPGIQADWLFHQYSEAGGLDRDFCHLDAGELRAWALGSQHPQQEDDMDLSQDNINRIADAVWNRMEAAGPGSKPTRLGTIVGWMDAVHEKQNGMITGLSKKIDGISLPAVSDAQLSALADKVAASPALSDAIAKKVTDAIAARLEA
ncbi:glycoside hydrolase family 25 protein [Streptomyces sp. NPDC055897]